LDALGAPTLTGGPLGSVIPEELDELLLIPEEEELELDELEDEDDELEVELDDALLFDALPPHAAKVAANSRDKLTLVKRATPHLLPI
jgi:hypothetical protein